MELVWNWIAVPGWLAAAVCTAMAVFLYRSAPTRRLNRRLAVLFLVEGVTMLTLMGFTQVQGESANALAWFRTGWVFYLALPLVYLLFIAELDSVLSRPLRHPVVVGVLVVATVAVELYFLGDASRFIPGVVQLRWGWEQLITPIYQPYVFVLSACYLYGLAAAIDAWRRAKTPVLRRRMKAFAIAFGTRDVLFGLHALAEVVGPSLPNGTVFTFYLVQLSLPLITLVYVPLVAYAILRTQLFDVDLKIKLGLSRGAVAAMIVVVFELVVQIVQNFATQGMSLLSGFVVAGALVVAAVPMSRAAERVADRLMPGVRDTEDYRRRRRLEMQAGLVEERFEPLRELGRGGEGRVTLALDRDLERQVVLKEPVVRDATARERVLREARLAARVSHPNIVTVYQVLPDAERPVIVMEHVAGGSLQDRLDREGRLPPGEVVRIGTDVLRGVERMHREGLLHRDLKPANVLLDPSGHAKVSDFGLAGQGAASGGTPGYMSPEQARGEPLDPRADVYSAGMLLLRALGTGPSAANTADVGASPAYLAAPAPVVAPPKLRAVLERATSREPSARYASAGEMLFALEGAA